MCDGGSKFIPKAAPKAKPRTEYPAFSPLAKEPLDNLVLCRGEDPLPVDINEIDAAEQPSNVLIELNAIQTRLAALPLLPIHLYNVRPR